MLIEQITINLSKLLYTFCNYESIRLNFVAIDDFWTQTEIDLMFLIHKDSIWNDSNAFYLVFSNILNSNEVSKFIHQQLLCIFNEILLQKMWIPSKSFGQTTNS